MSPTFRWLLVFLGLLFLGSLAAARADSLRYEVSGLDREQTQNVELYLEALHGVGPSQLKSFKAEIEQAIRHALQALGYYRPVIVMQVDKDNAEQLNIHISAGKPTKVAALNINLTGDAGQDKAFKRLRKKLPLSRGDIFNHGQYEAIKSELTDLALSRGYFDARLSRHTVKVSRDKTSADIDLELQSGTRYRFGEIDYGSMPIDTQALVNTLVTFKSDKPFKAVKLSKLNRDLSSTGYFSQIDIRPLKGEAKDFKVPVLIHVIPKTDHEIETGIGFSTDEGPRLSLNWDRPWLNEQGHSLTNELKLSSVNSELSSRYKIPVGNPLREYYSLELGFQSKTLEDTNSDLITAGVHRWSKRPGWWDRDLFFRAEYEDYKQGNDDDSKLLLIPGVSFSHRKARGGNTLDPKSGYVHNVKLEMSNKTWGSQADFLKIWGRTKWLTTVADKHRFIGRAEQGGIVVDNVTDIPPSIRFFTGGDQSVRGYSYESISPKGSDGKLTGARYMSAVSGEYNYEFVDKWRAAAFVDSGTATNDYSEKWKVAAGIGIRWVTPLGPLKVDLAFPINDKDKNHWRLHFSMGPEI